MRNRNPSNLMRGGLRSVKAAKCHEDQHILLEFALVGDVKISKFPLFKRFVFHPTPKRPGRRLPRILALESPQ